MELTKLEKQVVECLQKEYKVFVYEDNVAISNVENETKISTKILRGVLASLIKKEVVIYYGNEPQNKNCWNPIFMGTKWSEAIRSIN